MKKIVNRIMDISLTVKGDEKKVRQKGRFAYKKVNARRPTRMWGSPYELIFNLALAILHT